MTDQSRLSRILHATREEAPAVLFAFLYFFCILSSFYILRPVREEMGVRTGVENLQWLYTGTFVCMLLAVPLFGRLASMWPRHKLLPGVYVFFAANLWVFYALLESEAAPFATAVAFFIWLSVFNIFVVSVFWSFMADIFVAEQAKRLYGPIAAGGSAGAITGPLLTATFVKAVGIHNLMLVSSALLLCAVGFVFLLTNWAHRHGRTLNSRTDAALGGSAWAGIKFTLRSRYFGAIAGFILILALLNTFLYFEQTRLVRDAISDSVERTQLFAQMDLAVNIIAIVTQALLARFFLARLGVGAVLGGLMLISLAGFGALAIVPSLGLLIGLQIFRRATDYALIRPARETLFTVVTREEKYKAKNFIDTFVFRGGDAVSGWAYTGIGAVVAAPAVIMALAIPMAALGAFLGWSLGRQQEDRQQSIEAASASPAEPQVAPAIS